MKTLPDIKITIEMGTHQKHIHKGIYKYMSFATYYMKVVCERHTQFYYMLPHKVQ